MTASQSRTDGRTSEGVVFHLYAPESEPAGSHPDDGSGPRRSRAGTPVSGPVRSEAGAFFDDPGDAHDFKVRARSILVVVERLVQIWCSDERELAELNQLRRRMERVCDYLTSPHANPALGKACLERLELAHENHLTRLCSNHLELSQLLPLLDGELGTETAADCLQTLGRSQSQRSEVRPQLAHCWYA
jgi:hypothetical protein